MYGYGTHSYYCYGYCGWWSYDPPPSKFWTPTDRPGDGLSGLRNQPTYKPTQQPSTYG